MLAVVFFFVLAAVSDTLTVRWHEAREARAVWQASALSMVLESLTWAPVLWAVTTGELWVAAVSVLGSGVGTWHGIRRLPPAIPLAKTIERPGTKIA